MADLHPFPYQGSKRSIARYILPHFPGDIHTLYEPFCGSAAIAIAAAKQNLAGKYRLNDINKPLMDLWHAILERPDKLLRDYERLWWQQHDDRKAFFFKVRDEFNVSHQPHYLLYLLARIVKGSIRYSSSGVFNQSPDNRRLGMHPSTMRRHILGVSELMSTRTTLSSKDFREAASSADKDDLVYLDPPYQGTSSNRDRRYYNGVSYHDFVDALADLNKRGISYVVSYDGWTGGKSHGLTLPAHLELTHVLIDAGRSTQSTLLGRADKTLESLYLSPALIERTKYSDRPLALGPSRGQ